MQLNPLAVAHNRGIIVATDSSLTKEAVALPKVFASLDLAVQFLSACERTGVDLYPGMSYSDMNKLYLLWHDSYKRPEPRAVNDNDGLQRTG